MTSPASSTNAFDVAPAHEEPATPYATRMRVGRDRLAAAWCIWMFRHAQWSQFAAPDGKGLTVQVGDGGRGATILRDIGALAAQRGGPSALSIRAAMGPAAAAAQPKGDGDRAGPTLTIETVGTTYRCTVADATRNPSQPPPSTAVRHLPAQLSALMQGLATRPERDVGRMSLLTESEQAAVIEHGRGPQTPAALPRVHHAIEAQAARRPEAVAVAFAGSVLRYAELDEQANRVAHWLSAAGVADGSPVVVCMDPCLEFVVAMLAVFKAGGAIVVLEPSYPPARRQVIVDDTRPRATITHHARAQELPEMPGPVLVLDDAGGALDGLPSGPPKRDIRPTQTAYIVYTSGTTGKPKGVMVSHASLAHAIAVAQQAYGYGPKDTIPAMARFSFSITFFELLSPLCCGAELRLLARGDVLDLRTMTQVLREVTCIHASPSWWRAMLGHIVREGLAPATFDNLRHVSSGGDMVPVDIIEALKDTFSQAEVFVIYGCSEIACMGTTFPVPRGAQLPRTKVGRAFPNVSVRVLDPAGNVVPPGFCGEVCFGGAGLATGYLNAPAITAAKFATLGSERLYRTGDIGSIDEEGNLRLLGRSDFQINLHGFRIEPAEVELALRAQSEVADAVVVARATPAGDSKLVAYVVAAPGHTPSPHTMRAGLLRVLPDYMVPTHFVPVDALPLNHNGKVCRRALPSLAPTQRSAGEAAPPRNRVERAVLDAWRAALKDSEAGIHDDFFALGGDSLVGVELMTQIDRRLGVALPVSQLLTHPTVAALAPLVAPGRDTTAQASSVVCLRPGSGGPAMFFIHDGEGETIVYRNLARHLPAGCPVYGVRPRSSGSHPILHTRISEMVTHYAAEIRKTCPGPYVLGGLCVGGFLAFEVARALQTAGEPVALVALLDSAHVLAPKKGASERRLDSLSRSLAGIAQGSLPPSQLVARGVATLAKKVLNTVRYEVRTRATQQLSTAKIRTFRYCLDHGMRAPAALHHIGVDPTLRFAELEFVVPGIYAGDVVLFRATTPDPALAGTFVDDSPYREFIDDTMMGWEGKSTNFFIEDIAAGHSSMLQAHNAAMLADNIGRHLARVRAR